jgi:predicted deacetylase
MMKARYLFRMDDITPTMDWGRFWALLRLFQRNRVKPLLGIVPDNKDKKLDRQKPEAHFWDTMRLLVERDLVDIAQHGYQHLLARTSDSALLKHSHGKRVERSEFAGYSYQEQLERIQKGREILTQQGLATDYWFSPNHSFDLTTLSALKSAGFTAVSDGIALLPYTHRGLIFVPQQLWRPTWVPTGVFTICLHSNEITNGEIKSIRQFLRTPAHITSFGTEVRGFRQTKLDGITNSLFTGLYRGARRAQRALRTRATPLPAIPTNQPPELSPMRMDKGSISSI